jgi:hypothetical protein
MIAFKTQTGSLLIVALFQEDREGRKEGVPQHLYNDDDDDDDNDDDDDSDDDDDDDDVDDDNDDGNDGDGKDDVYLEHWLHGVHVFRSSNVIVVNQ